MTLEIGMLLVLIFRLIPDVVRKYLLAHVGRTIELADRDCSMSATPGEAISACSIAARTTVTSRLPECSWELWPFH